MILRTSQVAALMGVAKSTLWKWTLEDAVLRRCMLRRGYYDTEKLAAAGYIQQEAPQRERDEIAILAQRVAALEARLARMAQAVAQ